jgi:hypothetical protein
MQTLCFTQTIHTGTIHILITQKENYSLSAPADAVDDKL